MKRSLMPRWMTALLAAVLLAACAAPGEEAPIEEPSLPEQSLSQEAETPASQEEPAQEPSQEEASSQADSQLPAADAFYPSMATYRDYEGSALPGSVLRNRDGTLTFQHENTLNVLSPDNRLLQTVTLPPEELPESGYDLSWSDSRILAVEPEAPLYRNQYGAVCGTETGEIFLVNVTLFDREGKLVRQYPRSLVYDYDETDTYRIIPTSPQGEAAVWTANLNGISGGGLDGGVTNIHWIGPEEAVFDCHSRIVYYDFAADRGRVVGDMTQLVESHGNFGVYYGSDGMQSGVVDGWFYYLAHKNEEKSNTAGTVWRTNGEDAQPLFDGREFSHLMVGEEWLAAVDVSDEDWGDDQLYWADLSQEEPALREVGAFPISLPLMDSEGRLDFRVLLLGGSRPEENSRLCSYQPETGELTVYDLGERVQAEFYGTREEADGVLRFYYSTHRDGETTVWTAREGEDPQALSPETEEALANLLPGERSYVEYEEGEEIRLRVLPLPEA